MSTTYTNLPQTANIDSSQETLSVFDAYISSPVVIDSATYDAVSGFFGGRGFADVAAKNMAYVIIKQAKIDNLNPMQVIENLGTLQNVQLSNLITQILNFNRYKTSTIGTAVPFTTRANVARNILA